ncbi:unnamed protein product [Dovyalis caffra]|uniref:C2H2-type domain-containing protein n=1 Tax=Dovyalis caffra TaxID=77055 RepID=A0AAV1S961_9ROSI|nr:unnamed protein product [Dovyalis caffra]
MDKKYPQRSSTVKDKSEWNNVIFEGEHSSGFSLPQRNYTCSFCKREFSSAQALGGHMNVHRRDRAKLRQLPSWFFECPKPTSNSNPKTLLSPSSKFLPYPDLTHDHSLLSLSLASFSSPSYPEKRSIVECRQSIDLTKNKGSMGDHGFGQECDQLEAVMRRSEIIGLDLEMGCEDPKEFHLIKLYTWKEREIMTRDRQKREEVGHKKVQILTNTHFYPQHSRHAIHLVQAVESRAETPQKDTGADRDEERLGISNRLVCILPVDVDVDEKHNGPSPFTILITMAQDTKSAK